MIWKVEAEGDAVYVEAENLQAAQKRFQLRFGKIPKKLLTWTEVKEIPDGEEPI